MALGALAAPYIQGASYIVLLPAMTRLKGWTLGFAWLMSWISLLAIPFGDSTRPLAMLFPITLWALLFWQEWEEKKALRLVRANGESSEQPEVEEGGK